MKVAFVDRYVFFQQKRSIIGRPIEDFPAAPLDFEHLFIRLGIGGVEEVNVVVATVAPGGGIGVTQTGMRPSTAHVARFAVGEQGGGGIAGIEPVELVELAATIVLREEDIVPAHGRVTAAARRFGQKG